MALVLGKFYAYSPWKSLLKGKDLIHPPDRGGMVARERTTPNLKARKSIPVFWATFSPVRRGLFPVVRDFLCIIPTEQVLYYRNLGLYYGLASGTLPLYSGPCLGVEGGCVSCEDRGGWSQNFPL